MKGYDSILFERFPVRKTDEEKHAFLDYLLRELRDMGYEPSVESSGKGKSRNVVVGNPEKAVMVVCAHYDTPARKWLGHTVFPLNIPMFLLYQVLNMLLMLIPSLALYVLAWQAVGRRAVWVFLLSYLAMLLWQVFGTANRHNRNQSSGLAVMMEMLAALPESARKRTAFVFFDHGESFTLGARAYAKAHLEVQYTRLFLQLDAVGKGEELLLIPRKAARKCTGYQRLVRMTGETKGVEMHVAGDGLLICPGDYKCFQCGMILLACQRKPVLGFYIPHLHSPRDTQVDENQLMHLTEALTRAVASLSEPTQNHVDENR